MHSAEIDGVQPQTPTSASQLHQRRDLYAQNGHQQFDTAFASSQDNSGRSTSKPQPPTRSSTVGTVNELEKKHTASSYDGQPHARSEDLHHTRAENTTLSASPSGSPMPGFQTLSRPLTPNDSRSGASSSNHSENGGGFTDESTLKRMSTTSLSSAAGSKAASTTTGAPAQSTTCAQCSLPLEGAFVRALGNVWHLQCFKCKVRLGLHPQYLAVIRAYLLTAHYIHPGLRCCRCVQILPHRRP